MVLTASLELLLSFIRVRLSLFKSSRTLSDLVVSRDNGKSRLVIISMMTLRVSFG